VIAGTMALATDNAIKFANINFDHIAPPDEPEMLVALSAEELDQVSNRLCSLQASDFELAVHRNTMFLNRDRSHSHDEEELSHPKFDAPISSSSIENIGESDTHNVHEEDLGRLPVSGDTEHDNEWTIPPPESMPRQLQPLFYFLSREYKGLRESDRNICGRILRMCAEPSTTLKTIFDNTTLLVAVCHFLKNPNNSDGISEVGHYMGMLVSFIRDEYGVDLDDDDDDDDDDDEDRKE
jgi:hypothetical protein